MHQPGEPHVDIILDRIKQVIARDSRSADGARPARSGLSPLVAARGARRAEPFEDDGAEPADADEAAEVLELDEGGIVPGVELRLAEEGDLSEDEVVAADGFDAEGDEDLAAHGWSEPEGLGAADISGTNPAADDLGSPAPDAPLTRAETREATRDRLAALSMLSNLSRERQARGLDDLSIDALASDLLRPMLADWLDANLPPMVERLVQAEIRRIVGGS